MASALIVFGSTTGNTEYVAEVVTKKLTQDGMDVACKNASDVTADGLCDGYDLVLFGCSTWGDASIELSNDFVDLFDNFDSINASGKKTAVFGCGDSGYTYYCGAVDSISEKLVAMGATVLDTLKIDGDPKDEEAAIIEWTGKVRAAA